MNTEEDEYQRTTIGGHTTHSHGMHHQQHHEEGEEEDEDEKRESLYNFLKELREDADNSPVSRLLYVAYCNDAVIQAQGLELETYLQAKTRHPEEKDKELFQGYLLIKGAFLIHLLEGESTALNEFVEDLHRELHREKSIYLNINILAFNEENSTKHFDKWYFDNIYQAGPTLSTEIDKTDKQAQDRAWEIYHQISQAGIRHGQKKPKEKMQKKLASEITISTDDMSLFMSKHYMHIDDYHMLYLSDVEIQLDSEVQYPFQPSLTKTLEFATKGAFD